MSDMKILEYFSEFMSDKDFTYSVADVQFYLALFRYVEKCGSYDKTKNMHYVKLNSDNFASALGYGKTFFSKEIVRLEKFGIIERVDIGSFTEPYLTFVSLDI